MGDLLETSSTKLGCANGNFLRSGPKASLSAKGAIRSRACPETSVPASPGEPLFTLRYSLPIFRFLETLKSEGTTSLVENLRYRVTLPEGPDVEFHEVGPTQTAVKLEEVVTRWVSDGFCRLDEILILSPHGTKAKTSLANYSTIGDWPIVSIEDRTTRNLALISVNKAKGLDSLAVIMIDVENSTNSLLRKNR